jgi:hypothetical protein
MPHDSTQEFWNKAENNQQGDFFLKGNFLRLDQGIVIIGTLVLAHLVKNRPGAF